MNKDYDGPNSRIDAGDIYDIQDWADALGVPFEKLREAVDKAGPSVESVKKWLAAN